MTTWAAEAYIPRLIEAAALADVVVYVASDERYNDEIPTQFLKLLLQAGKPVVCLLAEDARGRRRRSDRAFSEGGAGPTARRSLPGRGRHAGDPAPEPATACRPGAPGPRYRIPLVNQVAVMGPAEHRPQAQRSSALPTSWSSSNEQLLGVARDDMEAPEELASTGRVRAGRAGKPLSDANTWPAKSFAASTMRWCG